MGKLQKSTSHRYYLSATERFDLNNIAFSAGPLEYFLNFGFGNLQQIEGEQIYHKRVIGVSLVACAHLCLAESSFKCTSFDYIYDDKSCYMSMYIAANVYGLVTSRADDKNVVHYEFKGK